MCGELIPRARPWSCTAGLNDAHVSSAGYIEFFTSSRIIRSAGNTPKAESAAPRGSQLPKQVRPPSKAARPLVPARQIKLQDPQAERPLVACVR